jgi:hypothetical protein
VFVGRFRKVRAAGPALPFPARWAAGCGSEDTLPPLWWGRAESRTARREPEWTSTDELERDQLPQRGANPRLFSHRSSCQLRTPVRPARKLSRTGAGHGAGGEVRTLPAASSTRAVCWGVEETPSLAATPHRYDMAQLQLRKRASLGPSRPRASFLGGTESRCRVPSYLHLRKEAVRGFQAATASSVHRS